MILCELGLDLFVRSPHLASLATPTRRDILASLGGIVPGAAAMPAATAAASVAAASSYPSSVTLSNGAIFPLASFGLQIYDDATAEKLTLLAIEAGFRNFFASVLARNQAGFARAIKRCGVPREELFICGSVVSNRAVAAATSKGSSSSHSPNVPSSCAAARNRSNANNILCHL